MKLYSHWRSTTSYRVRIALHLKQIAFETVPVDLVAGDQRDAEYLAVNPVAGVPALVLEDGTVLTQSMAILEWIEARHPNPTLIPRDPVQAALIRAAALVMAADVHPVNNLKVVQQLKAMGHDHDEAVAWMQDWMTRGFTAYDALIPGGAFSFGDVLSLADICLVAQLYNAHRWGVDLSPFPRLTEIEARCLALPAFDAAHPQNQPDAA
ncbi:maleylacetoacetate isomerase [Rhodophyticola sp. SM2404]